MSNIESRCIRDDIAKLDQIGVLACLEDLQRFVDSPVGVILHAALTRYHMFLVREEMNATHQSDITLAALASHFRKGEVNAIGMLLGDGFGLKSALEERYEKLQKEGGSDA